MRSGGRNPYASPWPGVLGGLVAVAAALLLRSLSGTRLLAELVVDATTYLLQARGFSFLLSLFGAVGKPLLFLTVLALELLLYALAWRLLGARVGRERGLLAGLATGALLAAALLVLAGLALAGLPETGLGSQTTAAEYVLVTLFASLLYAAVAGLYAASAVETPAGEVASSPSRRALLGRLPALALGGAAAILIGRGLLKSVGGGARASHAGKPTPEVTPTSDFYVVSKNLIDPALGAASWRLRVGGLTRRMLELSYEDILALPAVEQYATLQCISNEVNGDLMSNAAWTGVPLRSLIETAEPLSSAAYVSFRSADDYTESLPLEVALREGVLLAYAMNGEPLPDEHGFPLRLLVPGKYGIKNPKWLTEIALLDEEALGYWEERGWSNEARMKTTCRIDVPRSGRAVWESPLRIHGVAFSGDRGISRVEVSVDGGKEWRDAVLRPALSPYTWVLWYYDWTEAPPNGSVRIVARATDGAGRRQAEERSPPYPSGASGYPVVLALLRLPEETEGPR